MSSITCNICPHNCRLEEGQLGFCGARSNEQGTIIPINYGLITSLALDPIEKKPLYRFFPGSKILSVGSFGCNFRCSFCQNHEISMSKKNQVSTETVSPKELATIAKQLIPKGNIGIAYTYNEPLIGYEFVYDCAKEVQAQGMKNVLVTNGYINEGPFIKLLPFIDALNIDLKAFQNSFYQNISGDLETVMHTIELSAKYAHVEITTLIIPGENDKEEDIRALAKWLATLRKDIPLHLTRFFPRYQMADRQATDVNKVYALAKIAREYLDYVYEGNC